ncbi:hypothetical protein [Bernardetia sp. MNP-M8]|uniref:hypothetical protein n=1 Tax=Bernardetia sp. MNP-M8 TaxID=3127470 RepID=UPI0030CB0A6A
MKPYTILLFVLCFIQSIQAQNEENYVAKNIRLDIGLDYLKSNNQHLSFINSEGTILQTNLYFELEPTNSFIGLSLGLRNGELESKYAHYSPNYAEYYAELIYARNIWKNNKWNFKVGGAISYNLWIQQYKFATITDVVTLVPSLNLDVYTRLKYQISDKSVFLWSSSLGVMSKVGFPPYSTYDEYWIKDLDRGELLKNGSFKFINELFRWRNSFSYQKQLSNKFDIIVSFLSNHYKTGDVKKITFQSFGLQTSLKYKF